MTTDTRILTRTPVQLQQDIRLRNAQLAKPQVHQALTHLAAAQNQNNAETLTNIQGLIEAVLLLRKQLEEQQKTLLLQNARIQTLEEEKKELGEQLDQVQESHKTEMKAQNDRVAAVVTELKSLRSENQNKATKEEHSKLLDAFNQHAHGFYYHPGSGGRIHAGTEGPSVTVPKS
jgi:hypothetical protein